MPSPDRSAASVTLDTIIAKKIREALEECAVTNEIELADHHLDYLANWATEFASDALLANWQTVDEAIDAYLEAQTREVKQRRKEAS